MFVADMYVLTAKKHSAGYTGCIGAHVVLPAERRGWCVIIVIMAPVQAIASTPSHVGVVSDTVSHGQHLARFNSKERADL